MDKTTTKVKKIIAIICGSLLLVLALAIVLFLTIRVEMPDLDGEDLRDGRQMVNGYLFRVKVEREYHDTVPEDVIFAQSPASGDKIKLGSRITVKVSKGPDYVQVPDIVGKTLEEAQKDFATAGLTLQTEIQCSNLVQEGCVIGQSVKAGDMAIRNSTIVANISAGVANTVGNTPSNSSQGGHVAAQGNWVYYTNCNDDYSLYKMKKDGSEKQILTTDQVVCINVLGEWVYYTNMDSQNGGLYKIRIDGTQKTKLDSDISYFVHVADGWIYTQDPFGNGNIYRMRTDGTEKTQICGDDCKNIHIVGDWIYYINRTTEEIYKIRTDGSGKSKIRAGLIAGDMAVGGNAIVLTGDYNTFLKLNTNGTGYTKYSEYNTQHSFLNTNDGWLYFLEHKFSAPGVPESAFCKMKADGSEQIKIMDLEFRNTPNYFIHVVDDWLYFPNENDNGYLYRIKTDGTQLQKVYE